MWIAPCVCVDDKGKTGYSEMKIFLIIQLSSSDEERLTSLKEEQESKWKKKPRPKVIKRFLQRQPWYYLNRPDSSHRARGGAKSEQGASWQLKGCQDRPTQGCHRSFQPLEPIPILLTPKVSTLWASLRMMRVKQGMVVVVEAKDQNRRLCSWWWGMTLFIFSPRFYRPEMTNFPPNNLL